MGRHSRGEARAGLGLKSAPAVGIHPKLGKSRTTWSPGAAVPHSDRGHGAQSCIPTGWGGLPAMGRREKRHRKLQLQAPSSPSEHILETLLFGEWGGKELGLEQAGRVEPLSPCSCDAHQNGSRRAVKVSPCPRREGLIYCAAGSDSLGALRSFQSGPFCRLTALLLLQHRSVLDVPRLWISSDGCVWSCVPQPSPEHSPVTGQGWG